MMTAAWPCPGELEVVAPPPPRDTQPSFLCQVPAHALFPDPCTPPFPNPSPPHSPPFPPNPRPPLPQPAMCLALLAPTSNSEAPPVSTSPPLPLLLFAPLFPARDALAPNGRPYLTRGGKYSLRTVAVDLHSLGMATRPLTPEENGTSLGLLQMLCFFCVASLLFYRISSSFCTLSSFRTLCLRPSLLSLSSFRTLCLRPFLLSLSSQPLSTFYFSAFNSPPSCRVVRQSVQRTSGFRAGNVFVL